MKKNAGLAIVAVSTFQGKEAQADSRGLMPVYLTPVCGNVPNRNVLTGTVANNSGLQEGKSYLVKWTRLEDDPTYGPQYSWTKVNEITNPMDIIDAEARLGAGNIFDITTTSSTVAAEQEN